MASVSIPFIYSFERRMRFIKWWKQVFLSIAIVASVFIVWDIIFTKNGVWGFNEKYLIGLDIFGLPIEEWLFFICIPYACIFTHYAFIYFFPGLRLSRKVSNSISVLIVITLLLILVFNYDKAYTFYNYVLVITLLVYSLVTKEKSIQVFYITFLIILLPFFLVNGVLTGSFIEEQVVWYNDQENLGIRIGTIPIEDMGYAFSLLYLNLILIEKFTRGQIKVNR